MIQLLLIVSTCILVILLSLVSLQQYFANDHRLLLSSEYQLRKTTSSMTPTITPLNQRPNQKNELKTLSCSSIPTDSGYHATYSFFNHVKLPCVLFSGSAIGGKRHHGIVPIGSEKNSKDKDIDIACWSMDWSKDHILLENTLDDVFDSKWFVSLQGYYVSTGSSNNDGKEQQYFIDIWLHGPSDLTKKGTIDDPTRCLGFDRTTFESFSMYRILPELAYYMIKRPSKTKSKKHEWIDLGDDYPSCFLFYKWFGKQYLNKHFRSKDIEMGQSPSWPRGMFFRGNTLISQRTGLFGTKLVPIPADIDSYIKQRYGPIFMECGQAITSNAAPCDSTTWSSSGMVSVKQNKETLVIEKNGAEEVILHSIYKCDDEYSCHACGVDKSVKEGHRNN